ncbi:unnamed protein product [Gongylonema pulchrum]|uniref:Uncharacterized protein n=1 Tax=Gongylonema pulchrum TaxID=637853 RepID=A0A183CXA9_9BILA|nr:unnamed protein product [Gongylonema pulchrum]
MRLTTIGMRLQLDATEPLSSPDLAVQRYCSADAATTEDVAAAAAVGGDGDDDAKRAEVGCMERGPNNISPHTSRLIAASTTTEHGHTQTGDITHMRMHVQRDSRHTLHGTAAAFWTRFRFSPQPCKNKIPERGDDIRCMCSLISFAC